MNNVLVKRQGKACCKGPLVWQECAWKALNAIIVYYLKCMPFQPDLLILDAFGHDLALPKTYLPLFILLCFLAVTQMLTLCWFKPACTADGKVV